MLKYYFYYTEGSLNDEEEHQRDRSHSMDNPRQLSLSNSCLGSGGGGSLKKKNVAFSERAGSIPEDGENTAVNITESESNPKKIWKLRRFRKSHLSILNMKYRSFRWQADANRFDQISIINGEMERHIIPSSTVEFSKFNSRSFFIVYSSSWLIVNVSHA